MYIYSSKSMMPSARLLAQRVTEISGQRVRATSRPYNFLPSPCLLWGNPKPQDRMITPINSQELIAIATNKRLFAQKMVALGIPCVEYFQITPYPTSYPVVVRDTMTGYGGAGIHLAHSEEEWYPFRSRPYSLYRKFKPELGVHIFNGQIIRLFKKVRVDDAPEEEFPIRNMGRGYHFSLVNPSSYPKLLPFIQEFYSKFSIMFGRLDIGWDYEAKTYRVIEFNTAPGLTNNPDTLNAYAQAIEELL